VPARDDHSTVLFEQRTFAALSLVFAEHRDRIQAATAARQIVDETRGAELPIAGREDGEPCGLLPADARAVIRMREEGHRTNAGELLLQLNGPQAVQVDEVWPPITEGPQQIAPVRNSDPDWPAMRGRHHRLGAWNGTLEPAGDVVPTAGQSGNHPGKIRFNASGTRC
jgi:hypothetical protein